MDYNNINSLRQKRTIVILVTIFFSVLYMIQVVLNHYFLRTYALDYGFYNQAFWDFAHFRVNANTVMEPPLENFFQIHPGITLLLLSPLYYLFTPVFGTYSLLIIQNIFIILGGYAVYLLILQKSKNYLIAILAFLHFNLLWGHYSALSSDFIETTIASSMVPVFLLFFNKKKFVPALFIFLFIITCKENMPIWFIFIGITLALSYKDRVSRIMAMGIAAFSILYLIVLFKIVIPHFEQPGRPYWGFAYTGLGNNPVEALLFVISHPYEAIKLLFVNHLGDPQYNNIKAEFYIVFLISGGVLLFLRPVYLIPFIPIIAQKMYNDSFIRWGILGFYSIEVVSVLTVFAFIAIVESRLFYKKLILLVICASTLATTLVKMNQRTAFWYDDQKEAIIHREFYTTTLPVKEIIRAIDQFVPVDAPMVASQSIVPHYAFRHKIYIFPYVHDARYMVLLKKGDHLPGHSGAVQRIGKSIYQGPSMAGVMGQRPSAYS